jgi:hypothetical protein
MTQDCITVTCPRCTSNLRLDRKAVRTDFFICPACLEGEIAAPVATEVVMPPATVPQEERAPAMSGSRTV